MNSRGEKMFHADLSVCVDDVRDVLDHYRVSHWKATVIVRNPENPGAYVIVGNDDDAAMAAIRKALGCEQSPAEISTSSGANSND